MRTSTAKILSFRRNRAKSFQQMRQRELAWMLYITEGHIANMNHAIAVNCITFSLEDKQRLQNVLAHLDVLSTTLRELMQDIPHGEIENV